MAGARLATRTKHQHKNDYSRLEAFEHLTMKKHHAKSQIVQTSQLRFPLINIERWKYERQAFHSCIWLTAVHNGCAPAACSTNVTDSDDARNSLNILLRLISDAVLSNTQVDYQLPCIVNINLF